MKAPLVRLWEIIAGIPHKHENADRVSFASDELSTAARSLSARLKPYAESDDPLAALMADIAEVRRSGARDGDP